MKNNKEIRKKIRKHQKIMQSRELPQFQYENLDSCESSTVCLLRYVNRDVDKPPRLQRVLLPQLEAADLF